ncbi:unnamed protein product [Merluccius merluccius]
MNSKASVSDTKKSELNLPGVENTESTPEETTDIVSAPPSNTAPKYVNKRKKLDSNGNGESSNGSADILAAIQELSIKHDDMFRKISAIESTTEITSQHIEKLSSTVEQLVVDINHHKDILRRTELEIEQLKNENRMLRAGVAENKRYSYRWTLKLHGVKEDVNEDVRAVVFDILRKVAPGLCEYLQEGVDIAHRLGPRRKDGSHRSIIILFALRRIRDAVWKSARGCKFLRNNRLRLTEALSPEDRLAREKLWPLVEKARKEGKKASFLGPYALIDGKKIDHLDIG